ncbi:MAG TPA: GTP-binding protein, partial [Chthoniobacterales bacterium]|nr:GTP-binding protein [Chthoniobacterales bacterium]
TYLAKAVRLLRALNPKASILDANLERLELSSPSAGEKVGLDGDETITAASHLKTHWAIADAEFSRVEIRGLRPIHPTRFLMFVKEGWHGLIRARGQVRIASQPGTFRIWSQAGRVGVLGSRIPSVNGKWQQDLTLVGPLEACTHTCHSLKRTLLTDEEIELGPRLWRSFVDPFKDE